MLTIYFTLLNLFCQLITIYDKVFFKTYKSFAIFLAIVYNFIRKFLELYRFMNNVLSKTKQIIISTSDCYFKGEISPTAILSYCQDIAVEHADELGLGRKELIDKSIFWVVTKFSAKIFKQPKVYYKYSLVTYPLKPHRAEAHRDFYFIDEDGRAVIKATSAWSVLDIQKRRICRCNTLFDKFNEGQFTTNVALENGTEKIAMPDVERIIERNYTVNISDLDENYHMNNTKYGNVLLNAFNFEKFEQNSIAGFDLNYISELKLNDEYIIKLGEVDNYSVLEAYKNSDTEIKTYFRSKIYWNKRK